MPLTLDRPPGLSDLIGPLSVFVASYVGFRRESAPSARLREAIPLYATDAERSRVIPTKEWYLRVSLESEGETRVAGVVASRRRGAWRIDAIEEGDDLEEHLAWLEKTEANTDSAVGYYRDFDARVRTLYLVDEESHLVVEPQAQFGRRPVPTSGAAIMS